MIISFTYISDQPLLTRTGCDIIKINNDSDDYWDFKQYLQYNYDNQLVQNYVIVCKYS